MGGLYLIIHYGEIGTKGLNRPFFEKKLVDNLKWSLGDTVEKIFRLRGRILIELKEGFNVDDVKAKVLKVFGVSWFAFAEEAQQDINSIMECALKVSSEHIKHASTFKIHTIRADKSFPYTSLELNNILGEMFAKRTGLKVNLENPELCIYVEIADGRTFLYTERIKGLGGLPVSVSGKVICLLSGGIDSPVAAYLMMKRGCHVDFLHIHTLRNVEELRSSKIFKLFHLLSSYCKGSKLLAAPFYKFFERSLEAPPRMELVLFRKFMLKLAEAVAKRYGYLGIVTGDSIGQVASQTLHNILSAQKGIDIPIYRPLVSYDKDEIVNLAKSIGTYGISLEDYKDCCSIIARHPETLSDAEEVQRIWDRLGLDEAVKETLESIDIFEV